MKRLILTSLSFALVGFLYAEGVTKTVINQTAQGVGLNKVVDVGRFDRFSLQAVYSDGTPASHTISDGSKSRFSLDVADDATALISARAAANITVVSTTGISSDYIQLNGIRFTEGSQWDVGATTALTAEDIKLTIDAHRDFVATRVGSVVYASATLVGTYANGWAVSSSDDVNLSTSAETMTGGVDATTININGTVLTEGVDFTAVASGITTAGSITDAINANATLSAILTATNSASSVVYATASVAGASQYFVSVSTTGYDIGAGFTIGTASDIDISNDRVTEAGHLLTTGLAVLLTASAGTAPTGLTDKTTYYAIKVNENLYQLASSTTNAVAGTEIDITDVTGDGTFTIAPLSLVTGSAGFKWQASNDNSNWSDLSVSSVTYSAAGNSIWDIGEYDYRYLRMNFTAPTSGGIALVVNLHGKK